MLRVFSGGSELATSCFCWKVYRRCSYLTTYCSKSTMVRSCCVWGCTVRGSKGVEARFYSFPNVKKDAARRERWINAVKRIVVDPSPNRCLADGAVATGVGKQWKPKRWDCVCNRHFETGAPSSDPDHPDYVPSLHMTAKPDQKEPKMHRYNRVIKRRTLFNAPVSSSGIDQPPPSASGSSESSTPSASSQSVDADSCDNPDCITKMTSLENRIRGLEEKCRSLEIENTFVRNERDTLKTTLTKFSSPLKDITDKKMRFYTGIPTVTSFFWLFNIVCSLLSERRTISKENQLYLTLMKLRMGTSNRDLSYRFGISAGTVSSIFNECIPALASRLEFLIKWPSRDMLARNMPKKFLRRFRRCRVIIDCTEFFIDRPYNLKTRARTWSNYKHHHTLKALIGITPYGSVSFVSKMWGGRISDKEVTAKSHFYELIEYGDQVMADRGFTISNELAEKGATLVMPPFVKGRKQLPGMAVERARQLSALRIHVERAIERIKNFAILKNIMPLTFLPIASDILTVCAALTNLQPKLIN